MFPSILHIGEYNDENHMDKIFNEELDSMKVEHNSGKQQLYNKLQQFYKASESNVEEESKYLDD